mmetsp:Transcript_2887/g.7937  ORF Transcript_2887/g.7937 Transcript_2887/m.7937 type:complete len:122 (-) Transcript_2887:66-431(-)
MQGMKVTEASGSKSLGAVTVPVTATLPLSSSVFSTSSSPAPGHVALRLDFEKIPVLQEVFPIWNPGQEASTTEERNVIRPIHSDRPHIQRRRRRNARKADGCLMVARFQSVVARVYLMIAL